MRPDGRSDCNPLDLVQGDLIARVIVELGRSRGLVGGNGLCVLDGPTVLEVGGDPGRPEGVAARFVA